MRKLPFLLRLLPSNSPGDQVFQGAGKPAPFFVFLPVGRGGVWGCMTQAGRLYDCVLQPEGCRRCYSMVHMKTMISVSFMVGAVLAAPVFAQDQAVASVSSVPAQAAVSARTAAEVMIDGLKLMQSVDGVLKSVTDAASAANAVVPLQELKSRQEDLDSEWGVAAEKLSQEELDKLLASVQWMDVLDASLSAEVERLEKAGFFGNEDLKGLLVDAAPVEVEEDVTVVEEQAAPAAQPAAAQPAAPVQPAVVVQPAAPVQPVVQSAVVSDVSAAPAAAVRPVAAVLNDWSNLLKSAERLLKSVQDGGSAAAAVAELGRLRADYERLGKEMESIGSSTLADVAPEDLGAFLNQVSALQQTGASMLTEWKRIRDASFFGNEELKDLMQNFVPSVQVAAPATNAGPAQVQ